MAPSRPPITPTDLGAGPGGRKDASPLIPTPRGWAVLACFALGIAVLLTLCDWAAHVLTDTLVYVEPEQASLLPGQPTVRVFGGFLALAVPLTAVAWLGFRDFPTPRTGVTVALTAVFVLTYLISGWAGQYPMVLVAGFLLLWVVQLRWFRDGLYPVVVFCVMLAVIGPIAEGIYSASGFFGYTDAAVFGVPAWLGALYLNGALAVIAATATVAHIVPRRAQVPSPGAGP